MRSLALLALAAVACSSTPKSYPLTTIASGARSGFPTTYYRAFKTREEFERFAQGIRGASEFPKALPGVDWTQSIVVVAIGGDTPADQRLHFERASELGGAMIVICKRTREQTEPVFPDESAAGADRSAPARATPFVIATVPRFDGPVRVILSSGLLE